MTDNGAAVSVKLVVPLNVLVLPGNPALVVQNTLTVFVYWAFGAKMNKALPAKKVARYLQSENKIKRGDQV